MRIRISFLTSAVISRCGRSARCLLVPILSRPEEVRLGRGGDRWRGRREDQAYQNARQVSQGNEKTATMYYEMTIETPTCTTESLVTGPSKNDVCQMLGFFTPSPLSAFVTELQHGIHVANIIHGYSITFYYLTFSHL